MSKPKIKTACILMTGPVLLMDQRQGDPINTLPIKCQHCRLPDIDFIPTPYLLASGISAPTEATPALRGNFLVRERVRRILEVAVPNACCFHPTVEAKSKKPAPWWLAVPNQQLKALYPAPAPPFCPKCRASRWGADLAPTWKKMRRFDSCGVDVFKTLVWKARMAWGSDPPVPGFIERDLYFSARLEQLLKRAKVKRRLLRYLPFDDVKTTPEDEAWIQEKLKLLADRGLVGAPKAAAGKTASAAQKWFKQFLKRNAKKGFKPLDFVAVEQKRKLTLPQDYKDFIATAGPRSFADVCDMEGSTTTVLPPQELDFKDYRRGKVPNLEGEDAEVDGVMFAANDGGDCFVFDVSVKGGDYPVFWYRHEENTLEPFAPNFAACIKRFAQRN